MMTKIVTLYSVIPVSTDKARTTIMNWFNLNRTAYIVCNEQYQIVYPNYLTEEVRRVLFEKVGLIETD